MKRYPMLPEPDPIRFQIQPLLRLEEVILLGIILSFAAGALTSWLSIL